MATIDVAVADMAGVVDAFPTGLNANAGWSKGGSVQMGRSPDGYAAPSWWGGPQWAYDDRQWSRFQGWWYINVTDNSKRANNGRIQVRKVTSLLQRNDTGAWVQLGQTDSPGAEYYPASGSGAPTGSVQYRTTDPGGGRSFKFDANEGNKNIHGYGINADIGSYMGNVRNVCVTIEARLIKDNASLADDLDEMRLLCMAGGDYYPEPGINNRDMGVDYNPGIGCGRFKWLTRDWQIFVFWPSRNARGGAGVDNAAQLTINTRTRTESEFLAEPPPFTLDTGSTPAPTPTPTPTSAPAATDLGKFVFLGDSLFRGNGETQPYFSAPLSRVKANLEADGYAATFSGPRIAYPGSIPTYGVGGRKIIDLYADNGILPAEAPKRIVVSIGTNQLSLPDGDPTAGTQFTDWANALKGGLSGGLTGRHMYVFAPVNLSWFHQSSWTALRNAMQAWVAANSANATFGDLTEAGLNISGADGIGDGTHWSTTGANKVGDYIWTKIKATVGSGGTPGSPPPGGGATPPATGITGVRLVGLDLNAIIATAGSLPVGQQKAAFSARVISDLGAQPYIDLYVGGVQKYQSRESAPMTVTPTGDILFPSQWLEPPTLNTADPLTSNTAVLAVRNATNVNMQMQVAVKVGGGTGFLTASKAMDGAQPVRTNDLRILAPVTLDVGAGGGGDPGDTGGMYSKQVLINDMTLANQNGWGLELAPNTQKGSNVYAQITVSINRSDGDSGYPNRYISDNSLKTPYGYDKAVSDTSSINLLGWIVVGRGSGSTVRSSNSRVQIRGFKLLAYHRNGTWSTLSTDENGIIGASWHADFAYPGNETYTDIETGSALYQARVESAANGGGESLGSIGYGGWGTMTSKRGVQINKFEAFTLHAYPIGYTNNRKWWVDNIRGVTQVCEARMIVHDPTKADDRANANLMIWSGADWRADGVYLSDGAGVGRLKLVTNDWQVFSWSITPTSILNSNPPPGYS